MLTYVCQHFPGVEIAVMAYIPPVALVFVSISGQNLSIIKTKTEFGEISGIKADGMISTKHEQLPSGFE